MARLVVSTESRSDTDRRASMIANLPTSRRHIVEIISVAALGLRLFGLGRLCLWSDEMQRVTWAKGYEFDCVFNVRPTDTGVRLSPRSLDRTLDVVSSHLPPLNEAL